MALEHSGAWLIKTRAEAVISKMKVPPHARVDSLSGGQKKRVALARAQMGEPTILLLDEPTSALDADARDHVLAGLENLKQSRTTLVISHQPETLLSVDRILELDRGHLRSPTRR